MNTRIISASRAAGIALAVLVLASSADAQIRRIEKRFRVEGVPVITVQNTNGRIQVKAWDKNEILIVCRPASDSVTIDSEQAGNRIEVVTRVTATRPAPNDIRTDYDITVPTETELQIRIDTGGVTVERVRGDMSFDTVAADLALQDVAGYLVIKSIGGSLLCTRCAGRLDATSISGNVQLIQALMDNVRVQTSSGNILFDGSFLNRGIYVLKNYSGTIEVHVSSTDSFDVSATSLYGNVINEIPVMPDRHKMPAPRSLAKSLFGSMNQGHAKVELSSFSGTIKILKRK